MYRRKQTSIGRSTHGDNLGMNLGLTEVRVNPKFTPGWGDVEIPLKSVQNLIFLGLKLTKSAIIHNIEESAKNIDPF